MLFLVAGSSPRGLADARRRLRRAPVIAGRSEAAIASDALGQSLDRDELRARDGHHDQLRDAVADRDVVAPLGVGVEQGDLDLAAVAGIHRPGRVDDRDPVLRRQAAARHDERDEALGKGDAHAGAHERALPGFEPHRLGGHQVGAGVAGVRVGGNVGGDNEDVHRFSHPTRVMQKTARNVGVGSEYRERLGPSLWTLVSAAVAAPMAALVFAPLDTTVALVIGAAVGVGAHRAADRRRTGARSARRRAAGRPRSHRRRTCSATRSSSAASTARHARGAGLDPRSWHVIRGGIDGIVVVASHRSG